MRHRVLSNTATTTLSRLQRGGISDVLNMRINSVYCILLVDTPWPLHVQWHASLKLCNLHASYVPIIATRLVNLDHDNYAADLPLNLHEPKDSSKIDLES